MSGIYIQNMEMPKCHFKTGESHNVHGFWMVYPDGTSKLHIMVDRNHLVCDAIHVPDHGDLIDRNRIKYGHWGENLLALKDMVDKMPAIIPANYANKGAEE